MLVKLSSGQRLLTRYFYKGVVVVLLSIPRETETLDCFKTLEITDVENFEDYFE